MTVQEVLLPLFVEVLLTFVLLFWAAYLRVGNINSGAVQREDIALREPNWPKSTLQVCYAFANQFELPMLFYVLTILALVTKLADLIFVVLAWLFVLVRCVHAFVHVTSNNIRIRGPVFGVSALILFIMWVIYIFEILTLPRP